VAFNHSGLRAFDMFLKLQTVKMQELTEICFLKLSTLNTQVKLLWDGFLAN